MQKIFVSAGIIRLVLMFRKAGNIHFLLERRYKIVASRQVEFPFHRDIGRQRGRRFGALAEVHVRTATPLQRKYIVPAAKRVVADLWEFSVPETADVVSGRKNFKITAKKVPRQTQRKQLGSCGRKRSASRVVPTKSTKQTSRCRRDIFRNISGQSCRVLFGNKLLWQSLETLQEKVQ